MCLSAAGTDVTILVSVWPTGMLGHLWLLAPNPHHPQPAGQAQSVLGVCVSSASFGVASSVRALLLQDIRDELRAPGVNVSHDPSLWSLDPHRALVLAGDAVALQ